MERSLTDFYDDLKKDLNKPIRNANNFAMDDVSFKKKCVANCNKLKDDCRKKIIIDIYCKILPLDDEYKAGHMGALKQDVDNMLKCKDMTPTQYFMSASESTGAPLTRFIINATDLIGKKYTEAAEEVAKDAKENDLDLPEPTEPDVNDPEVDSQLVDVTSDMEYENFIDALKKKTIDKIVNDVTDIINKDSDTDDMKFEPKEESATLMAFDYLQKKTWNESADTEQMLGLAIREATLNQMDRVFNMKGSAFNEYASRIRFGKAYVITESAINELKK